MRFSQGFTIIEVVVALFILSLGAGAVFALIQNSAPAAANTALQLEASYLVQEGMEIVRSMRDSNFLRIHGGLGGAWTDGLTGCAAGCEADYNDTALAAFSGRKFNLNVPQGFYNYDAGTPTPLTRKITITQLAADQLALTVEVSWENRGRSQSLTAATELYNWLTPTP